MKEKFMSIIKKYYFPAMISLFIISYQAILYFLAKFTPFSPHMVGGEWDRFIPFIPEFILPYILWYLFLIIVPCALYNEDRENFYWYILSNILINTIATLIFIFYPTILNRPEIAVDNIFTWILNIIYVSDTPALNCFPSIHCASCFSVMYIMIKGNKIKRYCKVLGVLSSILIILSTLFVKQHALVDVVGAFLLSFAVVYFVKRFSVPSLVKNKIERKRKNE